MSNRTRHPAHRFIALLTAAVMPLCCCMVSTASGSSCCGPEPIVEVERSCCDASNCEDDAAQESQESTPCSDGGCSCCLKAPSTGSNWSPPIDTIGTPLLSFTMVDPCDAAAEHQRSRGVGENDPPPNPRDPDQLRGHVILQV